MEPNDAYVAIRAAIVRRPELRFRNWSRNPKHAAYFASQTSLSTYHGFCYIATQVFCHLVPDAKPYSVGRGHFWAQIGDEIWDPTADQFEGGYGFYGEGKRTRFKSMCKRARALLEETLNGDS